MEPNSAIPPLQAPLASGTFQLQLAISLSHQYGLLSQKQMFQELLCEYRAVVAAASRLSDPKAPEVPSTLPTPPTVSPTPYQAYPRLTPLSQLQASASPYYTAWLSNRPTSTGAASRNSPFSTPFAIIAATHPPPSFHHTSSTHSHPTFFMNDPSEASPLENLSFYLNSPFHPAKKSKYRQGTVHPSYWDGELFAASAETSASPIPSNSYETLLITPTTPTPSEPAAKRAVLSNLWFTPTTLSISSFDALKCLSFALEKNEMDHSKWRYILAYYAMEFKRPKEEILEYLFLNCKEVNLPGWPTKKTISDGIVGGPAGLYLLGRLYERESLLNSPNSAKYRADAIKVYIKCMEVCPLMWCALTRILALENTLMLILCLPYRQTDSSKNGTSILKERRFLHIAAAIGVMVPTAFADIAIDANIDSIIDSLFDRDKFKHRLALYLQRWGTDAFAKVQKDKSLSDTKAVDTMTFDPTICDYLKYLATVLKYVETYSSADAIDTLEWMHPFPINCCFVLELYGRSYFELGKYNKAVCYFKRCSLIQPSMFTHLPLWSTALWHLSKRVDLEVLVHTSFGLSVACPHIWCVLGNFYSLCNDSEEAVVAFRKACSVDPSYAYAYTLCAHENLAQEKFDEAQEMYETAVEIDPHHYNAHFGLGQIKAKREDYMGAIQCYSNALKCKSSSSAIYLQQAEIYEKLGKKMEALSNYELAVVYDPANSVARFKMGIILYDLEKYQESLECLHIAEKLAPLEGEIHIALKNVYSKLRQTKLAWLMLHKALHLAKDSKEQQRIREKLFKLWTEGSVLYLHKHLGSNRKDSLDEDSSSANYETNKLFKVFSFDGDGNAVMDTPQNKDDSSKLVSWVSITRRNIGETLIVKKLMTHFL